MLTLKDKSMNVLRTDIDVTLNTLGESKMNLNRIGKGFELCIHNKSMNKYLSIYTIYILYSLKILLGKFTDYYQFINTVTFQWKQYSVDKKDKQLLFLISPFDVILRVFACNLNAADLILTMYVNNNHIIQYI